MFNEEVLPPSAMLRILGSRFREYRLRLELTQAEVAEKAAISIPTIYKFENGRLTDISMANLLKLLKSIGLDSQWNKLIPSLPESPYMYRNEKKKQRVRHSK